MVGVYKEGDDIYLSNSLFIIENNFGKDDFKKWESDFRYNLNIEHHEDMSDFQYCVYGTINTHFKNFILKGPNDKRVIIPLEFTRAESFK